MSEFEIFKVKMDIRTRPYFDFSIDKYKSGLTEFVFTSSPDFYFLIGKKNPDTSGFQYLNLREQNPD